MIFEVFIPAGGAGGYDTTYQIDADNWRRALITGIRQTDLNFSGLEGCAVEIGEDETTVMHPGLKLTFRVKKLPDAKGSAKVIQAAVTGAFAAIPSRPPTDKLQIPQGGKPAGFKNKNTGTFRAIGAATGRAAIEPAPVLDGESGGPVRILSESNRPTGSKHEVLKPDISPTATSDENAALEDAFLELPALFERNMEIEDGIDFIADLTARLVPSANTSIFFASDGGGTFYCAQSRGQGIKKMLDHTVPMDRGLAALAVQGGRVISVFEPAKDVRNAAPLNEQLGFAEQSVLVAPIQAGERAFGVIILVNREKRTDGFSKSDANVAAYIGSEFGKYIEIQLDAGPLE